MLYFVYFPSKFYIKLIFYISGPKIGLRLDCLFLKVHLKYKSGLVRRIPKDDTDQKAVKQTAMGEYSYAVNALWEKQEIKDLILKKLTTDITKEWDGLCSLKNPSMLRSTSPDSLKIFDEKAHLAELRVRAPMLAAVLAASSAKTKRTLEQEDAKCDVSGVDIYCSQSMAASILLRSRCRKMSAQAYRVAIVLWHSRAKNR